MVAVSPGTFFPPRCFAETPATYCDNSSVAAIATHWRLAMIQSAVLIDHNNQGRLQWLPVESHDYFGDYIIIVESSLYY